MEEFLVEARLVEIAQLLLESLGRVQRAASQILNAINPEQSTPVAGKTSSGTAML